MISFWVKDKIYYVEENGIEAICLFGSSARGDFDSLSDIDLLFVINDCDEKEFVCNKKNIEVQIGLPSSWISVYRRHSIKQMHIYGSYFLWHLKVEGKILYSKTGFIEKVLTTLPQYSNTKEDLKEYLIICKDIYKSIETDDLTLYYELAVIASLVRNTCIAIAYLYNRMVFGRLEPIEVCLDILGSKVPFNVDEYQQLYSFRIFKLRNVAFKELVIPTREMVFNWLDKVELLINLALEMESEENGR